MWRFLDFWKQAVVTGGRLALFFGGLIVFFVGGSALAYFKLASHSAGWFFGGAAAVIVVVMVAAYQRWDEVDREATRLQAQVARGPAVDSQELVQAVDRFQASVANNQPCDFGDLPAGRPLHHDAFAAHFQTLSRAIDEWNQAVQRRSAAPEAVGARIKAEAQDYSLPAPAQDVDVIADKMTTWLVARALNGSLGTPFGLRWNHIEYPAPGKPAHTSYSIVIHLDSKAIASIPFEPRKTALARIAAITDAGDRLFKDAQGWPEVEEVQAAQDLVDGLRQPLLDELRTHLHVKPVTSTACPFCEAQRRQGTSS